MARADRARLGTGTSRAARRRPQGDGGDQEPVEGPHQETRVSQGYRLTQEAQANVDKIGAFIANDNVEAALRVLDALDEAFTLLAARPEIGHTREDLTKR